MKASSLQYKFADTVQVVKDDIKYDYKKNIYATSSKVARIVSFVLLQLPICLFAFIMMIFSPDGILNLILPLMAWVLYFIGMFLACHSVDKWYAISKEQERDFRSHRQYCLFLDLFSMDYIIM